MFEKYPRDLLQRFMVKSEQMDEEDEESEEIELNLGLSLGGRFGVDKKNSSKIIRSSSVASSFIRALDDVTNPLIPAASFPNLVRTASLPTETEEERRKRKELQSLKRMEAKRRRSEKLTQKCSGFSRPGKDDDGIGLKGGQNLAAVAADISGGPVVVQPVGFQNWVCAARPGLFGAAFDSLVKGKGSFLGGGGLQRTGSFGQANMQGSVESEGGSSSGVSDFESKPVQGTSSGGEPISPISNMSLQERTNQDTTRSTSKQPELKETGTSTMGEMPCVFTKGDGPNGRRVDGILYKYGKGEEVRIMCVCHGTFLSPAEFVQHAGGGDVRHPLRHIVISPASNSFL